MAEIGQDRRVQHEHLGSVGERELLEAVGQGAELGNGGGAPTEV